MIDRALEQPSPHVCDRPPEILTVQEPWHDDGPPVLIQRFNEGVRFICEECGSAQVCHWVKGHVSAGVAVCNGWEWVPESPRERRQRLGLRWWQR